MCRAQNGDNTLFMMLGIAIKALGNVLVVFLVAAILKFENARHLDFKIAAILFFYLNIYLSFQAT